MGRIPTVDSPTQLKFHIVDSDTNAIIILTILSEYQSIK